MLKFALHIHTSHSFDGYNTYARLYERARMDRRALDERVTSCPARLGSGGGLSRRAST